MKVLAASLEPDKTEWLRDLAAERAKLAKRTLNEKLKIAKQEHAKKRAPDERARRLAERQDPCPQIEVTTA